MATTCDLARIVEGPAPLSASAYATAPARCQECQRLLDTFVAFCHMVEARLAALERRSNVGVRGPGRLTEAVCLDCQRPYARRSVLSRRCDVCRREHKRQNNRSYLRDRRRHT